MIKVAVVFAINSILEQLRSSANDTYPTKVMKRIIMWEKIYIS